MVTPSSWTLSGNSDWLTPDDTTDGRPLASSSPRTMLASTADCVLKMTTSGAFIPPA
jgi:hypothetical protein